MIELVMKESNTIEHRGIRFSEKKNVRLATFDVVLDGEVIGQVARRMLTRERRTPGRRYVDARWTSPGWVYIEKGQWRSREVGSRREGVEHLLRYVAKLPWPDAEDLSRTAKERK